MLRSVSPLSLLVFGIALLLAPSHPAAAQPTEPTAPTDAPPAQRRTDDLLPRSAFTLPATGLALNRPAQKGTFLNVVGRRSAFLGYENESFETWAYPLKLLRDFRLSFKIEGYPLPYDGRDLMTHVEARPEATILTYTHAAFTVRQIVFAPVDEPGLVMLLDVDTARPLTLRGAFRPDLRLMWPGALPTENTAFHPEDGTYTLTVEGRPYAGVVGMPGAKDVSLMPYQEEPRDVPAQFERTLSPSDAKAGLVPLVMAAGFEGAPSARAAYDRILDSIPALYQRNVEHYTNVLDRSVRLHTPDERLNTAFDWALIGMDKGMATNPMLGTGLLAGFRTSGDSERPGFAWYFGRDALWTGLALTAAGDAQATRTALDFLRTFQRDDGKVPHEISQSAATLNWFEDFPYPWASADATPLYIIAHADLYATTGNRDFLADHWDTLKAAYRFSASTDADGDGLLDNVDVGHGWVEGGELYPVEEELYMQGLWVEAARSLAALARVMEEDELADEAEAAAERTRAAAEDAYWQPDRGHYAFGTTLPQGESGLYRQDTVLPAVPLWWGVLNPERAASQIDHLGSRAMATDWGHRIVSSQSDVYDPLAYHNGSVWPLFTGWASMGAYRYTRPHVGFQALMATALLTTQDALGYVTELLSGDYNTAFGRTSHHQIWSEAMVVTPALRGMLGLAHRDGGRTLEVAPQLPADWDSVRVRNVRAGSERFDLSIHRTDEALRIRLTPQGLTPQGLTPQGLTPQDGRGTLRQLVVAPALPRDARVQSASANGTDVLVTTEPAGDRMRARVTAPVQGATEIVIRRTRGTDAVLPVEAAAEGARSRGLRILRSTAGPDALTLVVEGPAGTTHRLPVRSPRSIMPPDDVPVVDTRGDVSILEINFPSEGRPAEPVRRTMKIDLGT